MPVTETIHLMLYLNTRKNKNICETAEPRNIWGEDKMCVGRLYQFANKLKPLWLYISTFTMLLLFCCCCFWHDIMEKHLHLQKSNKQVPWYSPFGPLYSWKYHSNTMVCEVQYPYKRVLCSTAVQKMVLDGNTMEMYLEMYFATEIHVPWCFWKCMVLPWYMSKILELQ